MSDLDAIRRRASEGKHLAWFGEHPDTDGARLSEIERYYLMDVTSLLAEVDRLNAEVELLRKEDATTQELGPDWRTKIAREVRRLRAENAAMREVVERD